MQAGIYDTFRERMAERLRNVKPGPAADPASDMGPLIDRPNVERVDRVVEAALRSGAKAIVRGGPITDGPLAAGAFYRPALLEVADNAMAIIQEETFGPVMTIQRFSTEADAIALANDNEYGPAASVWTRDVDRSLRVAQSLDAGSIWINDWAKVYGSTEEGGFKQSGLGRLNGIAAIDDFVEYKHIALSRAAEGASLWPVGGCVHHPALWCSCRPLVGTPRPRWKEACMRRGSLKSAPGGGPLGCPGRCGKALSCRCGAPAQPDPEALAHQVWAIPRRLGPSSLTCEPIVAKPNYSFEKRQRELAAKKKKDEKLARKQASRPAEAPEADAEAGEAADAE